MAAASGAAGSAVIFSSSGVGWIQLSAKAETPERISSRARNRRESFTRQLLTGEKSNSQNFRNRSRGLGSRSYGSTLVLWIGVKLQANSSRPWKCHPLANPARLRDLW